MRNKTESAVICTLGIVIFGFVLLSFSLGLLDQRGLGIIQKSNVSAAAAVGDESSTTKSRNTETDNGPAAPSPPVILIDAGHGGEDGGASSADGILEKDLNLQMSRNVASFCLIFGIPYEMTRDDDRLLYDLYGELESYNGRKKSLDLKNRLRLADENDTMLFLSIHMNKFPSKAVKGFQVYYSTNTPDAKPLAESMQTFVKNHIQPDNERAPKAADNSIYLLKNINTTALLAECGFLSNPEEAAYLSSPTYRSKLSASVFVPAAEYFVRRVVN